MKTALRRTCVFLLTLCLVLGTLPAQALTDDGTWQSVATRPAAGSGVEGDPYRITSPAELAWSLSGNKHSLLTADLDLSGRLWSPKDFYGTFDGGGYTVRGLGGASLVRDLTVSYSSSGLLMHVSVEGDENSSGPLLADSSEGTIRDCVAFGSLRYTAASMDSATAGLVKTNTGAMEGCYNFVDFTITSSLESSAQVGGLVYENSGTMTDCHNYGDLTLVLPEGDDPGQGAYLGGLAARMVGGTLTNCTNHGKLTLPYPEDAFSSYASTVGGLFAYSSTSSRTPELIVRECGNYAALSGGYCGGIGGNVTAQALSLLSGCRNQGEIAGAISAGGIVYIIAADTSSTGTARVENCVNTGAVTAMRDAGGIAARGSNAAFADCINQAPIQTQDADWGKAGGIVGDLSNGGRAEGCLNAGAVTGARDAGGIVASSDGVIQGCINTGTVTGWAAGGVVSDNTGAITDSGNLGPVSGGYTAGGVAASSSGTTALPDGTQPGLFRCYAQCDVTVTDGWRVAGVVGDSAAPIQDCYYQGTLTGSSGSSYIGIALLSGSAWARGCYAVFGVPEESSSVIGLSVPQGTSAQDCYANLGYDWTSEGVQIKTAQEMAQPAFVTALDVVDGVSRGVWTAGEPYPKLVLQAAPVAPLPSAAQNSWGSYYDTTDTRTVRVFPQGVGYIKADQVPPVVTATLPDGTQVVSTWVASCAQLTLPLDPDETGEVTFSCPGYVPQTLSAQYIGAFHYLRLWKDVGDGRPYLQSVLLDKSSGSYRRLVNLLGETCIVYVGNTDQSDLYLDVDWGDSGAGTLTLMQGDREAAQLNEGWNRGLMLGQLLKEEPGGLAVRLSAGSRTFLYPIRIDLYSASPAPINIDGGDVSEGEMPEDSDVMPKQKVKLDFGGLTDGLIPMEIEVTEPDNTFKAVIGMQLDKKGHTTAAFGKLKSAMEAWGSKDPSVAETDKLIRELEEYGIPKPTRGSFGVEGEVKVLGYGEGYIGSDCIPRFTQCGIIVCFEGEINYTQCFFPPVIPIPVYYEVGAKGELNINNPVMSYDPEAGRLVALNQTMDGKVKIYGGGGLGSPKVISGGIRGSGSLVVESAFPYDAQDATWYVRAEGSFVGSILGIKGEWTVWDTDYDWIIYRDGAWFPQDSNSASLLSWQADQLSRPARVTEGEFLANLALKPLAVEEALVTGQTIQTGVYENAQPRQVLFDDGTQLLVWVGDDPDRPLAGNCAALYYSFYNGQEWSQPAQVDPGDGTADYDPVLLKDGESAHLVWSDGDAPLTSDELGEEAIAEAMLAQGLSYARFDRETGGFYRTHFPHPGGRWLRPAGRPGGGGRGSRRGLGPQ